VFGAEGWGSLHKEPWLIGGLQPKCARRRDGVDGSSAVAHHFPESQVDSIESGKSDGTATSAAE
jgi:hypothetical protein